MRITVDMLDKVTPARFSAKQTANAKSVVVALEKYGSNPTIGLDLPHRQAQFLCQMFHENGDFKFDRELKNKDGSLTAAQKRYEGRADLGNTQPGDGEKFMGRTGFQLTGRSNYRQFTKWARTIDSNAPNFEQDPELVNTDPWEGLVPIWFWTSRRLNDYADQNDIETITKRVNGGMNGYDERLAYYTCVGLVLAGYDPGDILGFQRAAQSRGLLPPEADQIDGDPGPKTRAAIHKWLALKASAAIVADPSIQVSASPVTATQEVAVTPKGVENAAPDIGKVVGGAILTGGSAYVEPVLGTFGGLTPLVQLVLVGIGIGLLVWFFYGRQLLALRAKNIKKDVKETRDAGLPT